MSIFLRRDPIQVPRERLNQLEEIVVEKGGGFGEDFFFGGQKDQWRG